MHSLIEQHHDLLTQPEAGAFLYKIVSLENFLNMLRNNYLYFKRVDTYDVDENDSGQPLKDQILSKTSQFMFDPTDDAFQHYQRYRSRTYACCFSTDNSDHLWEHYGEKNASIRLMFDSKKLISFLNYRYENSKIFIDGQLFKNFLLINYGLVSYGNFQEQFLKTSLPNPIKYVYFKDNQYKDEKEFRISLSPGFSKDHILPNKKFFIFPNFIHLDFNFREALNTGALLSLEVQKISKLNFLKKLKKLQRIAKRHRIHIKLT